MTHHDRHTDADATQGGQPRTYLPSSYVDEWCPPLRPLPSDWIMRGLLGWQLVSCPDYMENDGDRPGAALTNGQVVKFNWREDWPDRIVTVQISEDGEITYDPVGYIPASINMFWLDGDFETMTDTLQSCLEAYHEMDGLMDGQQLRLSLSEWGEDSFRFIVDGDAANFAALALATRREPSDAGRAQDGETA